MSTDTGLLTPTPLAELKKEKSYFKMLVKRDKDLEVLRKKQEKVHNEIITMKTDNRSYTVVLLSVI